MIIKTSDQLNFALEALPKCPIPQNVLMVSPEHFEVLYVINPHMAEHVGNVDREKAQKEWQILHDTYQKIGLKVSVLAGSAGQPDMVFCANQTLPYYKDENNKGVFLSRMFAPERQAEVAFLEKHFSRNGYQIQPLQNVSDETVFEGMGDALWHFGHNLIWGGYGFRTDVSVYDQISAKLSAPVIALELLDPDFYHLDTCMSILNEDTVLICEEAFQPAGLELINQLFKNVIVAPEDESRNLFACNAHCPDGKHVIIQQGCNVTNGFLLEAGFKVIEVTTDEYRKSGGSVFCMKLMHW